jgi:putative spermidine/putrescine transport system permease protein
MFNSFLMQADPVISAASSLLLAVVLAGVGAQLAARFVSARMRARNAG